MNIRQINEKLKFIENETTELFGRKVKWNSDEVGTWDLNKIDSYTRKVGDYILRLSKTADGWIAMLEHKNSEIICFKHEDAQEALNYVYSKVKDEEWAKKESFIKPITIPSK